MHQLIKAAIAAAIISLVSACPGLSEEQPPEPAPPITVTPPAPAPVAAPTQTPREKIEGLIKVYKEHWYGGDVKYEYKLKDTKETEIRDTPIPEVPDLRDHTFKQIFKEYLIPVIVLIVVSLLKK